MSRFNSALKKEFLELTRTKSFFILLATSAVFALLAIAYVMLMYLIKSYMPVESLGEMTMLFEKSYASSLSFYMSFMSTFFLMVMIFIYMGSISKQIETKQWFLPINAGISPTHLISAKLIVSALAVVASVFAGGVLHFVLTLLLCEPNGFNMINFLISYGSFLFFALFILVITISLNAITKKRWPAAVTSIVSIVLLPPILGAFKIFGKPFATFTPFSFYNLAMSPQSASALGFWQVFISIFATVLIAAGLILWAALSKKIKPQKDFFSFKNAQKSQKTHK